MLVYGICNDAHNNSWTLYKNMKIACPHSTLITLPCDFIEKKQWILSSHWKISITFESTLLSFPCTCWNFSFYRLKFSSGFLSANRKLINVASKSFIVTQSARQKCIPCTQGIKSFFRSYPHDECHSPIKYFTAVYYKNQQEAQQRQKVLETKYAITL